MDRPRSYLGAAPLALGLLAAEAARAERRAPLPMPARPPEPENRAKRRREEKTARKLERAILRHERS